MSDMGPGTAGGYEGDSNARMLAGFGYIVWIVALVALLVEPYKEQPFVRFHAYQALALALVIYVIGWVPVLGWIIAVVAVVFAVIGAINAFQGRRYDVPVLADLLRGWFQI